MTVTRATARSVFDDYLPGYARERYYGPYRIVSGYDLPALVSRIKAIQQLPWGERERARKAIAEDFGVSVRTVQRYARSELFIVDIDGWQALFTGRPGQPPAQATAWERAA